MLHSITAVLMFTIRVACLTARFTYSPINRVGTYVKVLKCLPWLTSCTGHRTARLIKVAVG
ncbi:Uncharacterised protein [Vibrio cholerae]|nr:Uncharacterised protein [Vibrio cholerae]